MGRAKTCVAFCSALLSFMLSGEILNLKPTINMLRMMLAAVSSRIKQAAKLTTCNTLTSLEQSSKTAVSNVLYSRTQVQ